METQNDFNLTELEVGRVTLPDTGYFTKDVKLRS